jgi:hypothetical protein
VDSLTAVPIYFILCSLAASCSHGAMGDNVLAGLRVPRLERAIGVIYRPETERQSHYFHANLPDQFDAVLHFDETRAIKPLESTAEWKRAKCHRPSPSRHEVAQ